jgi:putative chitinase
MELYEKYKTLFGKYQVNTSLRIAYFMGTRESENGTGKPVRESCYYTTIEKLRKTFKTPFKGKTDAFVSRYLKNSEKCANYVYANREGNGNEASGDGYKYRGGGDFQQTFRNGYTKLAKSTGIPFDKNPDLILEEANSLISALEYWKNNDLNKYADADNLDAVSDIVNIGHRTTKIGDANGYEHRKEYVNKWKKLINKND